MDNQEVKLSVHNLKISFRTDAGKVQAVGNAAGRGACICARWESAIQQAQQACLTVNHLVKFIKNRNL